MRDAYILGFRFKYLSRKGIPASIANKTGSVTRDGISLHDHRIFLRDVYKTGRHGSRLVISLKPYATLPKEICQYVLPHHNALVLQVDELMAAKVKSVIDRQCTALLARDKWGHLKKEERDKQFQRIECPRCEAIIDLTHLVPSNLVYCKYCEAIFDKFGYLISGSEDYRICPECKYYGRVQDYFEFSATPFKQAGEKGMKGRALHCCDTCAHRIFKRNFWRNMPFVFGSAVNAIDKLRSKRDRNPLYKGLQRANYHAQNRDLLKADVLFTDLVLRNDRHPGILFNYGKLFLEVEQPDRAAYQFKKSLDACSNYKPTLDELKKNLALQDLVRLSRQSGIVD